MATAGTMKRTPVQSARETITIEFETGRHPMLRNPSSRQSEQIVFVNRKYQLLVNESTIFLRGNTTGEELVWSLEVEGVDYELRERSSETFL